MKIKAFGFSDIGIKRPNNEDAWLSLPEKRFFALADGMGGHNAGEVASKETISSLRLLAEEKFGSTPFSKELITLLENAFHEANQRVWMLGQKNKEYYGMGTTLCVLYLYKDAVIYAHVGDSRIYRYRKKEIILLTEDHIHTNTAKRRILTRAIGTSSKTTPAIASASAIKGDIFFMCSDGLTDFVSELEIEEILKKSRSLKKAVFRLIEKAKEKGSNDNITILMIKVARDGRKNLSR